MTHNKYIAFIAGSALLSWFGFFLVLTKLSPFRSLELALGFFYLTLFIALSGTFTVFGFYFRVWLFENEVFYRHITVSMRQGAFLSLIAATCLILQSLRALSWWSGLLVIVVAVLLEFYFSLRDLEFA